MWLTIQETSLAIFVGLRQGELGNALSLLFSGHLTIAVNVYKKSLPFAENDSKLSEFKF